MSNQKHESTGKTSGALVPAWLPGDLIDKVKTAVKDTGQSRSFVLAKSIEVGLPGAVKKILASAAKATNGKSSKRPAKKK